MFVHCSLRDKKGYWYTIGGINPSNYVPATKEQRTKLFEAMREAGYVWDAEKKELMKIDNEIEIPFGAYDSELQDATYYIPKGFHAEIDDDKVVIKKGEKPAEWSEEDEKMIRGLIVICDEWTTSHSFYPIGNCEMEKLKKWLKFLRPQKQWKPTKEQTDALDEVYKTHGANSACRRVLITLLNDLKKLSE